jgi:Uncharacterized protein conserved in bacteria
LILDSSALISLIFREQGYGRLLAAIESAPEIAIGAPTLSHANAVIVDRLGLRGRAVLALFLERSRTRVIAFDDGHRQIAASASIRYGKGRHQAALSVDDCMAYATAHLAGSPLLAVGTRFPLTDLPIATDDG